jgi:hypothetical protein
MGWSPVLGPANAGGKKAQGTLEVIEVHLHPASNTSPYTER